MSVPDSAGQALLMSVGVQSGPPAPVDAAKGGAMAVSRPRIGRPRPLFPIGAGLAFASIPARSYDVAPDGQRFYAMQYREPSPAPPTTHINLILNWFEELKVKAPAKSRRAPRP